MKRKSYLFLEIILIVIFVGSGYKIATYFYQENLQKNKFEYLAKKIENTVSDNNIITTNNGNKIKSKYAQVYNENNDFVGWIKIKETRIDYPVMKNETDFQYYLYKNFDKEESIYGTPFIGENCEINPNSDNIIVYGHNMKNGTMFSDLNKYKDYDFYKKHKKIEFNTLYDDEKYEIAYAFVTEVNKKGEFDYYNYINISEQNIYQDFIKNLEKEKLYDTDVKIQEGDKVITLSTCEKRSNNSRMVVVAKRVE